MAASAAVPQLRSEATTGGTDRSGAKVAIKKIISDSPDAKVADPKGSATCAERTRL